MGSCVEFDVHRQTVTFKNKIADFHKIKPNPEFCTVTVLLRVTFILISLAKTIKFSVQMIKYCSILR